jgi:hypothetical protein
MAFSYLVGCLPAVKSQSEAYAEDSSTFLWWSFLDWVAKVNKLFDFLRNRYKAVPWRKAIPVSLSP